MALSRLLRISHRVLLTSRPVQGTVASFFGIGLVLLVRLTSPLQAFIQSHALLLNIGSFPWSDNILIAHDLLTLTSSIAGLSVFIAAISAVMVLTFRLIGLKIPAQAAVSVLAWSVFTGVLVALLQYAWSLVYTVTNPALIVQIVQAYATSVLIGLPFGIGWVIGTENLKPSRKRR